MVARFVANISKALFLDEEGLEDYCEMGRQQYVECQLRSAYDALGKEFNAPEFRADEIVVTSNETTIFVSFCGEGNLEATFELPQVPCHVIGYERAHSDYTEFSVADGEFKGSNSFRGWIGGVEGTRYLDGSYDTTYYCLYEGNTMECLEWIAKRKVTP